MKIKLGGILLVVMFFGMAMNLVAEENNLNMNSNLLFLHNNWINSEITFFSSGTADHNTRISPRIAGWLNIIFGLGSFIMGDVGGGFSVLGIQLVGWGIPLIGVATGDVDWDNTNNNTSLGNTLMDIGAPVIAVGWIWGFIRPYLYERRINETKTARLDDIRNWDIELVSGRNGNLAGKIAFTAHYK